MYNNRLIGSFYEDMATNYLKEKGYEILERNFFCKCGEIDIIAKDKGYIVFIEVKYRKTNKVGLPLEAVSYRKKQNIIKVAKYYLYKKWYGENIPVRFDVVGIEGNKLKVVKDAFWI